MLDKVAATGGEASIEHLMAEMGKRARKAARDLSTAPSDTKDLALHKMADAILASIDTILSENAGDVARAQEAGMGAAFIDRLTLNPARIIAMAEGVRAIAELADPVGSVIAAWERPNGLKIERVRTPLGVIGVIYESRPNVTADAGALCLKAGNAVILRGGSDSARSSAAIHAALRAGLEEAGLHVRNQVGAAGHIHGGTGVFAHDVERPFDRLGSMISEGWQPQHVIAPSRPRSRRRSRGEPR